MKHLDVETLWLQEVVKNKEVELNKIAGEENMADLLTKHLSRAVLERHVAAIGFKDA
jgi:hypothetical protein